MQKVMIEYSRFSIPETIYDKGKDIKSFLFYSQHLHLEIIFLFFSSPQATHYQQGFKGSKKGTTKVGLVHAFISLFFCYRN